MLYNAHFSLFRNSTSGFGIVFSISKPTSVLSGNSYEKSPCYFSMTNLLGFYRGAAIYEIGEVDPSEGKTFGSKVIAKAMIPEQENMKVDFIEEAATQDKALEKVKKAIDKYLADHEIDQFVTDSL